MKGRPVLAFSFVMVGMFLVWWWLSILNILNWGKTMFKIAFGGLIGFLVYVLVMEIIKIREGKNVETSMVSITEEDLIQGVMALIFFFTILLIIISVSIEMFL